MKTLKNKNSNNAIEIEEIASVLMLLLGLMCVSVPGTIADFMPYFACLYLVITVFINIIKWVKNHDAKSCFGTILSIALTVALIVLFVTLNRSTAVAITMGAYCVLKSVRLIVFDIIGNTRGKSKVFVTINTLIHLMLATSIFYSLIKGNSAINEFIVMYGTLYLFEGVVSFFSAFSKKHYGTLLHILKESYAKEILSGLVFAMVVASFLLVFIEPDINSFGDGIWYCFALVTTIGFGDKVATTAPGRLISVLIGIYGIVVVALVTSVIVNIYTEKKEQDKNNKQK